MKDRKVDLQKCVRNLICLQFNQEGEYLSDYDHFYVIFLTEKYHPLREIMDLKKADPRLDNRTFNRVVRKAKALGADHFKVLMAVPRLFTVDYGAECNDCGQAIKGEQPK